MSSYDVRCAGTGKQNSYLLHDDHESRNIWLLGLFNNTLSDLYIILLCVKNIHVTTVECS